VGDGRLDIGVGGSRPWGATTCGHGIGATPDCNAPAEFHLLWLKSKARSTACGEHMALVRRVAWQQPYEAHGFSPDCGMPGSLWHRPTASDPESYCYWPAPDDPSMLTEQHTLLDVMSVPE
jgi:hypothetical protein